MSYAVISDDNTHDVDFIYKVIEIVTNGIKIIVPNIERLHLFTDGCVQVTTKTKNRFSVCAYINMSSTSKLSGISLLLHMEEHCVMV